MMGRFLMYATIGALALFVLSSYVLLSHGGGSIAQVQEVSIHDLTSRPQAFNGQPVTTTGLLSFSNEHGEYQVVGDGSFGVILKDDDLHVDLGQWLNEQVQVSGVFGIDEVLGVFIDTHGAKAAEQQ